MDIYSRKPHENGIGKSAPGSQWRTVMGIRMQVKIDFLTHLYSHDRMAKVWPLALTFLPTALGISSS
jgi:hypothetical protein